MQQAGEVSTISGSGRAVGARWRADAFVTRHHEVPTMCMLDIAQTIRRVVYSLSASIVNTLNNTILNIYLEILGSSWVIVNGQLKKLFSCRQHRKRITVLCYKSRAKRVGGDRY